MSEVVELLHNPLLYEENLISIINVKGDLIPLSHISGLYDSEKKTIKLEGMEKYSLDVFNQAKFYAKEYNHNGPVTCHVFVAQKGSPSFNEHVDPDDVIMYIAEGSKTLIVDGKYILLEAGQELFIPANTPHQALNEDASVMLSFGLEKFLKDKMKNYELDAISKDDGNLQFKL